MFFLAGCLSEPDFPLLKIREVHGSAGSKDVTEKQQAWFVDWTLERACSICRVYGGDKAVLPRRRQLIATKVTAVDALIVAGINQNIVQSSIPFGLRNNDSQ